MSASDNISLRDHVLAFAAARYGTEPERPWAKYPGNIVLRHQNNKKWFALMMNVPKAKLGLAGNSCIDVLNVKTGALLSGTLREERGILPAYHMNKTNWVTVLLDGTVTRERIEALLEISFDLTGNII